jgi:hypothetical protein
MPEKFPDFSGRFGNMLPAYCQYPGSILLIPWQDIENFSGEILQFLMMVLPKQPDKLFGR